ncbi:MAG: hypothetical protein ACOC98_05810, partial [Thermodesulfobacteriota bacterium]
MTKRKNEVILDVAILALAIAFLFALPQTLAAAGGGDHGRKKADMHDPDTSETMEQEAEETAQDVRQGTRGAARETEQAMEDVSQETAELAAETERIIERATLSLEEVVEADEPRIPEELIR